MKEFSFKNDSFEVKTVVNSCMICHEPTNDPNPFYICDKCKAKENRCLVIKIPEIIYKQILKGHVSKKTISKIFSNGTPLPEDEKVIDAIDFAIKATDSQDDYSIGMRNGMRYVKSLIDGKEPQYELRRTNEEIKLGIDIGDEVVGDHGSKGVVVGIDTHKEAGVMLSLLMGNYKVPQLVKASNYKKTGRHFPQIVEVLEQMRGL